MQISVHDYAQECAEQGLRGDYTKCRSDFTVEQPADYSAAEQAVWRTLCERQTKLTERLAHRSYLDGVEALGLLDGIPHFDAVSERLRPLTGWEIVAVPGLIPAGPFFDHLANRRFPVTNWLRTRDELDYIVEPDMFHDFFGHVPILTQPVLRRLHADVRREGAGTVRPRRRRHGHAALLVHGRIRTDRGAGPAAEGLRGRADVVLHRTHPRGGRARRTMCPSTSRR